MTFNEWWKIFIKDNLTCINHKKDFEKCWDAAESEGWREGNADGFQHGFDQASSE